MASFKFNGPDEFIRELDRLANKSRKRSKDGGADIREAFNREFMMMYTKHETIDDFFVAAGGVPNPDGDSWSFADDVDLDAFVAANSEFDDYAEMKAAATERTL